VNRHDDRAQGDRIRNPVPTSGTLLTFDLANEVSRLEAEQPWQAEHTANTIVKFPDFRIVLIAIKAGGRLREHRTAGRVSIHCVAGEMKVHVQDELVALAAGTLLCLDRDVPHEVEAATDSVFLLTIAWPK
jgi:quercetin dioxygenase-like cupin family protein